MRFSEFVRVLHQHNNARSYNTYKVPIKCNIYLSISFPEVHVQLFRQMCRYISIIIFKLHKRRSKVT